MLVIVACKYEKDQMKNSREKSETLFSHYNLMGVICCHGNQFQSDLAQNLLQPFPYPNDASDSVAIGLLVAEIFMFESVYRRTHARTNGRRLDCYPISSPLSIRFRLAKIVYPCKPQFLLYIKVGCKGVYIARTC